MENANWTIKSMMDWMIPYLAKHNDPNPKISAQWLISDATGLSRVELYMNLDKPLDNRELDLLHDYVNRRGQGEPLQYITGNTNFRHIQLKIGNGVLIPRPETEVLVSELQAKLPRLKYKHSDTIKKMVSGVEDYDLMTASEDEEIDILEKKVSSDFGIQFKLDESFATENELSSAITNVQTDDVVKIIDICTGAGPIAISLAYEHPNVEVIATDNSQAAIELAKENSDGYDLSNRITFYTCNMIDEIDCKDKSIDAIVSNPPYIPSAIIDSLSDEVKNFEMRSALDGGVDGLDFFRQILQIGKRYLKDDGILACELHETTLDNALELAKVAGYKEIEIKYDLANKPRILICKL